MSPRRNPVTAWPWRADTPLDRAKRAAQIYRHELSRYAPEVCADIDRRLIQMGQRWVAPTVSVHDDDDQLTTELAAEFLGVQPRTIDEYRRRGLPVLRTPDGPRYRVGDLRAWRTQRRRAR